MRATNARRGDLAVGLLVLATAACRIGGHEAVDRPMSGWLLIAPPNLYIDGGARMDERAPLWKWTRLAAFDDVVACRRFRDARIADAESDEAWAMWSMSRCESAERAEGARLTPDEETRDR